MSLWKTSVAAIVSSLVASVILALAGAVAVGIALLAVALIVGAGLLIYRSIRAYRRQREAFHNLCKDVQWLRAAHQEHVLHDVLRQAEANGWRQQVAFDEEDHAMRYFAHDHGREFAISLNATDAVRLRKTLGLAEPDPNALIKAWQAPAIPQHPSEGYGPMGDMT